MREDHILETIGDLYNFEKISDLYKLVTTSDIIKGDPRHSFRYFPPHVLLRRGSSGTFNSNRVIFSLFLKRLEENDCDLYEDVAGKGERKRDSANLRE